MEKNNKVILFGINNEGLKIHPDYVIPQRRLHFLEKEVMRKVLNYFEQEKIESSQEGYRENVVVVDIFVKSGDKFIIEDGHPQIHTVVLWNKDSEATEYPSKEIGLIDPNEPKFNRHICSSPDSDFKP